MISSLSEVILGLDSIFENSGYYEFDSNGHGFYRTHRLIIVDYWYESTIFDGLGVFTTSDFEKEDILRDYRYFPSLEDLKSSLDFT